MADPQSGSQNGSIQQGQQQQQQSQPQHTEASQGSSNNGGNLSLPPSQGPPQEASPNSQSQPISNPSQLFSQATTSTADTDASLMPPPTPGGAASGSTSNAGAGPSGGAARSSGRAIKPTMKVRGDSEEPFHQRSRSASGSISGNAAAQNYGFRSRKSTAQSASSQGNSSRALRLKLNLKGGHASRGKGDPTLAGVNKTLPYMQGYDRELDSSDDETGEGMAFEEQLILRMPENLEATKMLGEWVRKREVGNDGKEVEFKFKDSRRAVFKMGDKQFSSKLVDLPAIIESHKTLDNKQLFKIADISQMLLVTHQVNDESEVTRSDGLDKVEGLTDDFIYDHGITPPMRWARKRRFRKRIHKRTIETVEKEVERLLAEDERAEDHEYAMIDVAEADMSDSDDEGGGGGGAGRRARKNGINRGSPTASLAPSGVADGASEMGEEDDEEIFSQVGEGDVSVMEGEEEDDDVDLDLERELEQEMMLQQQEDEEEEDEEEDESTMGDGKRARGRSLSRATSDDDDEEDEDDEEEDEDDLFDAGVDEEGGVEGTAVEGGEREDDEDDDDDMDEEEQERRVRETQLEAECKEIEAMVKRKNTELEGTNNALIKQRNLQTLKRMQVELDMKKSQLIDLKQQRKEVKEAAKAEAQAQAQAQAEAEQQAAANAAAAQAAADPARTSSSATPSGTAAAASTGGAGAGTAGQPGVSKAVEGGTVPLSDPSSKVPTSMDIDKDPSTVNSTTKGASNAGKKASSSSQPAKKVAVAGDDSMDVDGEPDSVQADGDEDEDEEDEDEEDDDEDDEDDDLFG